MRDYLYLASLLYQVGAFYQRAAKACPELCPKDPPETRALKPFAINPGPWTLRFVDDHHDTIDWLKLPADDSPGTEGLTPTQILTAILSPTDEAGDGRWKALHDVLMRGHTLALGSDAAPSVPNDADKKCPAQPETLVPITWTVGKSEQELRQTACTWHMPLQEISIKDGCLPVQGGANDSKAIGKLWETFASAFGRLDFTDCRTMGEALLDLLFKYTVNVPANANLSPCDISLYDQARSAAAFTLCLYDAAHDKASETEEPLLLIGADLSGIQPYIYAIASKYASKSLKGRSFYLRLLTDAVAAHLMKRLDLYEAQVVYNSGGGFYLLAPNTANVRERLTQTIDEIEHHLFEAHGTALYLAIDSTPLPLAALTANDAKQLSKTWGELFDKRDQKKRRRFEQMIANDYESFFTPQAPGLNGQCDACTGEYFGPDETPTSEGSGDKRIAPIRTSTKEQIELGARLKKVDVIIECDEALPELEEAAPHINPAGLTRHYYFATTQQLAEMSDKLDPLAERVTLVALNDDTFAQLLATNLHRLTFYGGNEVHEATFERLCDNRKPADDGTRHWEKADFSRLGILRMDVDNLGHLFQEGFKDRHVTLAHMAELSRALDFFFSGYLNTIWHETNPDHSTIIYSGGDDVFIVGDWRVTISLAERIHDDFRKYCCENKEFSISGGIALIDPKFPIIKGAEMSGEEESRAKGHSCYKKSEKKAAEPQEKKVEQKVYASQKMRSGFAGQTLADKKNGRNKKTNQPKRNAVQAKASPKKEQHKSNKPKYATYEKNSLSFLGVALNFDLERDKVEKLKDRIVERCEAKDLPRSFISKVLSHWEHSGLYKSWLDSTSSTTDTHSITNVKTYWMLTYDLGRLKERHLSDAAVQLVDQCQKECCGNPDMLGGELITTPYHALELWALACRWAELELRS